eukprot:1106971-Pyramimonas_sp.AAC.1
MPTSPKKETHKISSSVKRDTVTREFRSSLSVHTHTENDDHYRRLHAYAGANGYGGHPRRSAGKDEAHFYANISVLRAAGTSLCPWLR